MRPLPPLVRGRSGGGGARGVRGRRAPRGGACGAAFLGGASHQRVARQRHGVLRALPAALRLLSERGDRRGRGGRGGERRAPGRDVPGAAGAGRAQRQLRHADALRSRGARGRRLGARARAGASRRMEHVRVRDGRRCAGERGHGRRVPRGFQVRRRRAGATRMRPITPRSPWRRSRPWWRRRADRRSTRWTASSV